MSRLSGLVSYSYTGYVGSLGYTGSIGAASAIGYTGSSGGGGGGLGYTGSAGTGGGGGSTGDITFNASDISSDATVNLIVGSVGTETITASFSVQNPMYGALLMANELESWTGGTALVTGAQLTIVDTSFGNGTIVIQLTSDLVYDSITYAAWVADYTLISGSISGAGFPASSASVSVDNSHTWSFGADGNLTVPSGSTINTVTVGTLYHSSNIITPLPTACCYNNTTTYTTNPLIVNGALCVVGNITASEGMRGFDSYNNIVLGNGICHQSSQYGGNNVAVGKGAMANPIADGGQTRSCYSVAIGTDALCNAFCSWGSIAIGAGAMCGHNQAPLSIAIGYHALGGTDPNNYTVACCNIAIGYYAASGNCGNNNVVIGNQAMNAQGNAGSNVAIGYGVLASHCAWGGNVAIGSQAWGSGICPSCSVGIGQFAGYNHQNGCNNIFIGYCSGLPAKSSGWYDSCNATVIGNNGTNCQMAGLSTWTALSDQRDKANIEDIPVGLDLIMDVRPVKFTWNTRDGLRTGIPDSGFIAQELLAVIKKHNVESFLKLANDDHPDVLVADPGKLMPVVVKAIQELATENIAIKARLAALEAR